MGNFVWIWILGDITRFFSPVFSVILLPSYHFTNFVNMFVILSSLFLTKVFLLIFISLRYTDVPNSFLFF